MKKDKSRRPGKGKPLPVFHSAEQESTFWDQHSPLDYGSWTEIPYNEMLNELKKESLRKKQISLRLEPQLVENLKRIARRYGIPYQKLAREFIRLGVAGVSRPQERP